MLLRVLQLDLMGVDRGWPGGMLTTVKGRVMRAPRATLLVREVGPVLVAEMTRVAVPPGATVAGVNAAPATGMLARMVWVSAVGVLEGLCSGDPV